jgi:hypothetical protein
MTTPPQNPTMSDVDETLTNGETNTDEANEATRVSQTVNNNQGQVIGVIQRAEFNYTTDRVLQLAPFQIANYFPPSNASNLIEILKQEHIILLESPPRWGSRYLVYYLAQAIDAYLFIDDDETDEDDGILEIYRPAREATGEAILSLLQIQDVDVDEEIVEQNVVYIANAKPENFHQQIESLQTKARELDLYIILAFETDEARSWATNNYLSDSIRWYVKLHQLQPYTSDDLTQWACQLIRRDERAIQKSLNLRILADETTPITPELVIKQSDNQTTTLRDVVIEYLNTPYLVVRIVAYILQVEVDGDLLEEIQLAIDEKSDYLKRWFDNQAERTRYILLAVALVNNIPQQTFWAIYERLILQPWRERDTNLQMMDYHQIQLSGYIDSGGEQIGFADDLDRDYLLPYIFKSYRRALVNALPVISDLLISTSEDRVRRGLDLANLEIWGSELDSREEAVARRRRLRDSLLESIVVINRHEPETSRHILMNWAQQYEFRRSDGRSRQDAFADVIKHMYWRDRDEKHYWQQRYSLNLIADWFDEIRVKPTDLSTINTHEVSRLLEAIEEDKRLNVLRALLRATLAYTLSSFTQLPQFVGERFGTLESAQYLTTAPDERIKSEDLSSLWAMIVAFAWDVNAITRLNLIMDASRFLLKNHPHHLQGLLILLASDWEAEIRLQVALRLAELYDNDAEHPMWLSTVYYLLETPTNDDVIPQRKNFPIGHYLLTTASNHPLDIPYHHWTATFAMLLIGGNAPNVLRVYVQTMLNETNTSSFRAYSEVMNYILRIRFTRSTQRGQNRDEPLYNLFKNQIALILKERTRENLLTPAGRLIYDECKDDGRLRVLLSNTEITALETVINQENIEFAT